VLAVSSFVIKQWCTRDGDVNSKVSAFKERHTDKLHAQWLEMEDEAGALL